MRTAIVALAVLSACTGPGTRMRVGDPTAASVRSVRVEVVNASGRELPMAPPSMTDDVADVASSPSLTRGVARLAAGRSTRSLATADAFAAAAAAVLREKGVRVVDTDAPVLRVTLLDVDIRNRDAGGAVAFVSASYRLLDPPRQSLWETTQTRLPIRLAGPDVTRSELVRIAVDAVSRGLVSFPPR